MEVLWTLADGARVIAALPTAGALPRRTVLVPSERVHALRRELIRGGFASALAGTRFVPVLAAAITVLRGAEVGFEPGEEALRPARLLALFASPLDLRHFPLHLLRERPGWDQAFARTIGDLEDAALGPDDLEGAGVPADMTERLADVATLWRALDAGAGASRCAPKACWRVSRRSSILSPAPGTAVFFSRATSIS